jgi:hypothetical protein
MVFRNFGSSCPNQTKPRSQKLGQPNTTAARRILAAKRFGRVCNQTHRMCGQTHSSPKLGQRVKETKVFMKRQFQIRVLWLERMENYDQQCSWPDSTVNSVAREHFWPAGLKT